VPVRTDPIATYRIPKRRGTRRMAVLSERDARRWHDLAGRVAMALEPRLPGSVLANRVPLGAALRVAATASTHLARRARVLVRTDVASFYPSVRPAVLAEAVAAAGADPEDARLAAGMLDGWWSEGYPGLPIGPPGSAVLANAVLHPVDGALDGRPFLRWVDDYLIGCPNERDAARVLEGIDEALDRLSLRRAPGKTFLEEPRLPFRWLGEVSGPVPPRR
jgi:Reverse transcriptase (RNA-dependent DNA polymerase)